MKEIIHHNLNTYIEFTKQALALDSLVLEKTQSLSHGAEVFFVGKVRNYNHQKKVSAVAYDIYEPLAKASLLEICQEAQQKWGTSLMIDVRHRYGRLDVGDISVTIRVSSPHRDEAYQASRYVIEQIKVRVPIWKKEFYENGETEWLRGHALCQHG